MAKTVLITGASQGIGVAAARLFYENGYSVIINYNQSEKEALMLEKELKGSLAVKCDVSNEEDVKEMVDIAIKKYGKIDVLINNAGISKQNLISDVSCEEWDKMFAVNVRGTFLVSKYVLSHMIRYKSGKIINVSSIWGVSGASCETCYSATKGAIISFTKALAKELGPSKITVNAVAPGFIDTKMNENLSEEDKAAFCEETPLGRIGTSEEVANTLLLLASEKASFITGQVLTVDGGVTV